MANQAHGIVVELEGQPTDYLKTNFCEPKNRDIIAPLFPGNQITMAGYPGVFDIIVRNTDACREKPYVVNGFECLGTKKTFLIMVTREISFHIFVMS